MAARSYEEFRSIAHYDGDGWALFVATRSMDFDITPSEWLLEAAPYANEGTELGRALLWADAVIGYNAWAASVGRPSAQIGDIMDAGAIGSLLKSTMEEPAGRADVKDGAIDDQLTALRSAQSIANEYLQSLGRDKRP